MHVLLQWQLWVIEQAQPLNNQSCTFESGLKKYKTHFITLISSRLVLENIRIHIRKKSFDRE